MHLNQTRTISKKLKTDQDYFFTTLLHILISFSVSRASLFLAIVISQAEQKFVTSNFSWFCLSRVCRLVSYRQWRFFMLWNLYNVFFLVQPGVLHHILKGGLFSGANQLVSSAIVVSALRDFDCLRLYLTSDML